MLLLRRRSVLLLRLFLLLSAASSTISAASACPTSFSFSDIPVVSLSSCLLLPSQNATLSWSRPSPSSLHIVFSSQAPSPSGWVAWGLNLANKLSMLGTRSFIAFRASNGSFISTYNITTYNGNFHPSPIELHVLQTSVLISSSNLVTMYASFLLPSSHSSASTFYHVWNRGSSVTNFSPAPHSFSTDDLSGLKAIDMPVIASSPSPSPSISSLSSPSPSISPPAAVSPSPAPASASTSSSSTPTSSGGCSTSFSFRGENKIFSHCSNLVVQNAAMAWTLGPASPSGNRTLDVLFSGTAPASGGWVGWGINPGPKPAMAGTQAFIAFQASNGSTILTYNVTEASKGGDLPCTPIDLEVLQMEVEISGGTSIAMFVSIALKPNQSTSLNFVWNRGSQVTNFVPGIHSLASADLKGLETIDVASGGGSVSVTRPPHQTLKNRHGVLNVVGWGILLPFGVIVARYFRFADPAWFYVHVFLQISGYAIGVAGWATGLRLGNYSVGVVYHKHRIIAIVLFTIATLQMCAILLRPKKEHKFRKAWNLYHYALGASILTLSILNIFYGFDILSPPKRWRRAYVAVLLAIAGVAMLLEVISWFYILANRKRSAGNKPSLSGANVVAAPSPHHP